MGWQLRWAFRIDVRSHRKGSERVDIFWGSFPGSQMATHSQHQHRWGGGGLTKHLQEALNSIFCDQWALEATAQWRTLQSDSVTHVLMCGLYQLLWVGVKRHILPTLHYIFSVWSKCRFPAWVEKVIYQDRPSQNESHHTCLFQNGKCPLSLTLCHFCSISNPSFKTNISSFNFIFHGRIRHRIWLNITLSPLFCPR